MVTWCEVEEDEPAGRNGRGFFLARDVVDSAPVRSLSIGVLGRDADVGLLPVSVLDGGLSYRDISGFAGDCGWDRMVGIDRLSFNSCALVVVGSLRRPVTDVFDPSSLRRGVDGGTEWVEMGVVGVGILVIDDCDECPPSLDCDLRLRFAIGPPLSETGSSCDGTLSWPPRGRGSREFVARAGLFVKVNETDVFGRTGLVWRVVLTLMLRFKVSLLESKTSSPISRPDKKSSLTSARFAACFSLL